MRPNAVCLRTLSRRGMDAARGATALPYFHRATNPVPQTRPEISMKNKLSAAAAAALRHPTAPLADKKHSPAAPESDSRAPGAHANGGHGHGHANGKGNGKSRA